MPLKTEHSDETISVAQEWMHKNFHQTFPLEKPAESAGMSLRNFVRRFKQATGDSPLIYLQKLRVAAAKRLLEGDQDVVFFRKIFQRHTGVSPSAYRQKFGI